MQISQKPHISNLTSQSLYCHLPKSGVGKNGDHTSTGSMETRPGVAHGGRGGRSKDRTTWRLEEPVGLCQPKARGFFHPLRCPTAQKTTVPLGYHFPPVRRVDRRGGRGGAAALLSRSRRPWFLEDLKLLKSCTELHPGVLWCFIRDF